MPAVETGSREAGQLDRAQEHRAVAVDGLELGVRDVVVERRHRVGDAHGELVVAPGVRAQLATVDADEDLEERRR